MVYYGLVDGEEMCGSPKEGFSFNTVKSICRNCWDTDDMVVGLANPNVEHIQNLVRNYGAALISYNHPKVLVSSDRHNSKYCDDLGF